MPILQEEEGWTDPSHQKPEKEKDKHKYHSQEFSGSPQKRYLSPQMYESFSSFIMMLQFYKRHMGTMADPQPILE
jgi:hypothetical protein